MHIRAIITDLGNVVVPFDPRRLARALVRDRLVPLTAAEIFAVTDSEDGGAHRLRFERGDITDEQFVRGLETRFEVLLPRQVFWQAWLEIFGAPNLKIQALWRAVKQRGVALIALTNTDPYRLGHMLAAADLPFDAVVASCQVGMIKPEPQIFHRAVEFAGCAAAECFFVDDDERNVLAARALGIPSHHFTAYDALAADLRQLSVIV